MQALRNTAIKLRTIGELLGFLWENKMWWLIPMVLVLSVFGLIIVIGSASGIGPFVYTLF